MSGTYTHNDDCLFFCAALRKLSKRLLYLGYLYREGFNNTIIIIIITTTTITTQSYIKAVVSPVRAKCTSLLVRWFLSLAFFPMMSHLPPLPSLDSESRAVGELGSNGWDRFVVLLLSLLCGEEGAWSGLRWSGGPCGRDGMGRDGMLRVAIDGWMGDYLR